MSIDTSSPAWLAIEELIRDSIAKHDRLLKEPGLPMAETENARGAIQFGEALLKSVNPSKIGFAAYEPD